MLTRQPKHSATDLLRRYVIMKLPLSEWVRISLCSTESLVISEATSTRFTEEMLTITGFHFSFSKDSGLKKHNRTATKSQSQSQDLNLWRNDLICVCHRLKSKDKGLIFRWSVIRKALFSLTGCKNPTSEIIFYYFQETILASNSLKKFITVYLSTSVYILWHWAHLADMWLEKNSDMVKLFKNNSIFFLFKSEVKTVETVK